MEDRPDRDPEEFPEGEGEGEYPPKDTIPAETMPDPLLGTLIDERYLLLSCLGEGGMGQVYQARHVLMDKPVAVKVLHEDLAHMQDLTKRFEREAQSSSRLSDPHIITVTDFGRTDDGRHYLVMELLDGESLAERIDRDGALPVAETLRITRQILKGLAHAHVQGVIHRDLKPENVMLVRHGDESDYVKILDFGIAKLADGGGGESLTRSGVVFGTPKYLSPEQALGEQVDSRGDLYAVGVMLWEMLVGAPPFAGETAMDTMSMHLTGDIPRLRRHGSFPRGLQQLVDRALAKKAAERFQDAGEFIAALADIDPEGPGERTSPSQVVETLERITSIDGRGRRSRTWLLLLGALSALVAALLLVYGLGVGGFGDRAQEPRGANRESLSPEEEQRALEKRKLELARRQLDDNLIEEAAATVRELLRVNPSLSHAHMLLGHARFLSAERAEAMDSYELALTADPGIIDEPGMREHLRTALDWDASRDKAALLLARFGGEEGLESLVEMSNSALFPPNKRQAARQALEEAGHEGRIDWLVSLTADFNQRTRCRERQQIIAEMEATGNPGFLPLLEEYRPVTTRKGRKTFTTNPCIGPDVLRAIRTIKEKLADAGPADAGPERAGR